MAEIEQAIGAIVVVGAALFALAYGGGFLWYTAVTYPVAIRKARRAGFVVLGRDLLGDEVVADYREGVWRRATFNEWRKVKSYDDEPDPVLWPSVPR